MSDKKTYTLLELNYIYLAEIQKLNEAMKRKNYANRRLKENLEIARNQIKVLRDLPPRIVERDMATGKTLRIAAHVTQMSEEDLYRISQAKVPPGNEFLDELIDQNLYGDNDSWGDSWDDEYEPSENPDSGKV